eukprot:1394229-Pyramimonas_sp.AAC.1
MDDTCYYTIEYTVDWHGLGVPQRRQKRPQLIKKLITTHAPPMEVLTFWRDDSAQGRTLLHDIGKGLDINGP